jgi:hypothetical protein
MAEFLGVIASEAKQSSLRCDNLDCFVAELVIGPATSGRTRWLLAMTILRGQGAALYGPPARDK